MKEHTKRKEKGINENRKTEKENKRHWTGQRREIERRRQGKEE